MRVAIIDYGSGNLRSATKAFERAARSLELPEKIVVTRDPETVYRADRIVLPGVGAFADCRKGLDALDGMVDAMTQAVRALGLAAGNDPFMTLAFLSLAVLPSLRLTDDGLVDVEAFAFTSLYVE